MSRKRKVYDDDDGRTIADMSGVSVPGMFGHRPPARPKKDDRQEEAEGEHLDLTRRESLMYILGTMKAALLIGLVYIVGLGLIIGLMVLFWHIL